MPQPFQESFYSKFPTLVDALRWWSEKAPERPAVVFLADGENETARFTYAELDREARRVAASLQKFMDPGSRALLCFPPGLDFVVAYLGCLYARIIAVPVFAPRNARHLSRLSAVAASAGAAVALTDAKTVRTMQAKRMGAVLDVPWLITEAAGSRESVDWQPPEITPSDIAFLQYTSGSTSTPNGVIVTHENLASNIAMMGRQFDNHPSTRCVSWLPVQHDMGLIGAVLMPLWQGLFTAIMPPASFAQKPERWLRAISKYRATIIMAPNFGFELCCRQVDAGDIAGLDLSSLEVVCNGAEPIRAETLEKFCQMFAPAGFARSAFYPCYGLAECTLYAAGHHLGQDSGILVEKAGFELGRITEADGGPGSHRVVSCGSPQAGETLAIVNPQTMQESAADEIGEIWLAGEHVAKGYWNNPEATARVFGAILPGYGETPFLRTGDLGFRHAGQLFVTGRLKDVIIVFGRNHYPQDIELTVEAHPAVRAGNCVAFSLAQEGVEGLGIVAEIENAHLHDDLTRVADAISASVWEEHEISILQLAFLKPAGLPKTSSGKLQRRHTRDLLIRNELPDFFRWPGVPAQDSTDGAGGTDGTPAADGTPRADSPLRQRLLSMPVAARKRALLDLVNAEICVALGRSPGDRLPVAGPLQALGLDSLRATDLRKRLATMAGLPLPVTLLFDYPTPGELTGYLTMLLGLDADAAAVQAASAEGQAEGGKAEGGQAGGEKTDDIAIVSMSCRFPGGADTPEALWELLAEGRDAIAEFPRGRGWATLDGDQMPIGGALPDAEEFDPAFFGISAREAIAIDPQQRLLLELSWEALERASIVPAELQGSPAGVFVGISPNDYGGRLRDGGAVPAALKGYLGTGSQPSVASGRIAYTLGLEGPAISVDTSCSASLVALHLACQALRHGECSLAFAGGVTVIATLAVFSEMSPESAGAPDGRCKAFSAEADGAGWSEGAGMLLLERLPDARRNGHPVLAVVRGSAVNQDGRSQGLTAPHGPSQERVIRQALASARLSAAEVDAVEAHGTGTMLGDPIEARALLATYGQAHDRDRPLWLGSLKSNLGHTQQAAGIGGVIKMVLALNHRLLPKTLHARNPSPHIDWSAGTIRLLSEATAWTGNGHPRRGAISAFGVSGTNAHVIVEEAPGADEAGAGEPAARPRIALPFLLSARNDAGLAAQAAALRTHLAGHPELELADLAYSLATTRSHFEHRAVLVAADTQVLQEQLQAMATGQPAPGTVLGQPNVAGKVAFVFPGHGPQWTGMALSLLDSSPVFRSQIEACERALAPHVDWSLTGVLRGREGAPDMDEVDVVQPVLFAVTVALAGMWRSMGLEPDAVVGHSLGEIAAAYVAGALSLEDAARVVALRGRVTRRLAGQGAVAAVELPEAQLTERLAGFGQRLSFAAVNSPDAMLVSGPTADIDALLVELADARVFARKVRIDYASHSWQIDAIEDELRTGLAGLEPRASAVPFYSSVTGARLDTRQLDAGYWYRNLRQQVRFAEVSQNLLADGHRFFIETSSHPALVVPLLQTLERADVPTMVTGSLRRDQDALSCLLLALGTLHSRGFVLDWEAFFRPLRPRRVGLPTYAFQRERFWLEAPGARSADVTSAGLAAADHPLLGAAIPLADGGGLVLTGRISLARHAWLAGYTVFGRVILPGSVFIELALAAAHRAGLDQVEELTLENALALPAEGGVTVQLMVGAPDHRGSRPLTVHARPDDAAPDLPWTRYASGFLSPAAAPAPSGLRTWPPARAAALPLDGLYERLAGAGLGYGVAFRGLRAAWRRDEELFAEVELDASLAREAGLFGLHPALLDAALHGAALDGAALDGAHEGEQLELLASWSGVQLHAVGATTLRVRLERQRGGQTVALQLADAAGELVATVTALTTRSVTAGQLVDELAARDQHQLLWVDWAELPGVPDLTPARTIAVVGASDFVPAVQDGAVHVEYHADFASLTGGLDQGSPAPDLAVIPCVSGDAPADVPAAARAASAAALELLQGWLADERLAGSRLVLLTRNAVAAGPGEDVLDLAHAALWGLARTAQSEHPDRGICLIDTDDSDVSRRALAAAVLSGQPQIALRDGRELAPRLARAPAPVDAGPELLADGTVLTSGTVLITGGTGTLGALVARHLVDKHAVRHLVLTSRQGPAAPGAQALRQELEAAGARVTLAACDVADRDAVRALLAAVPAAHPLTAVVHTAGVLDDTVLTTLTPEQLNRVMRAKAESAWYLHELTQAPQPPAFVMFSSAAGALGAPGQANYAAASVFLDALACHRRAQGSHAVAIDWGLWGEKSSFTAHLDSADYQRIARSGIRPLATREGLALLDAALRQPHPAVTAAHVDFAALAANAQTLPPILRGLVPAAASRRSAANTPSPSTLRQRLLAQSLPDAVRLMLDLVRAEAAVILGLTSPSMIEAERSLESIGLDSLRALELRNRLSAVTGLTLPVHLVRSRGPITDLARGILDKLLVDMTFHNNEKNETSADAQDDAYQHEVL